jgi:glutaconyl-CoA/methylmalonyl-CoA decarboxylase subunit gamma
MATQYQVTVGERTLQVRLRRAGDRLFASVDGGEEQSVRLTTVHGVLRSLERGEQRFELLAAVAPDRVDVVLGGMEYAAEVLDEAHARLAQVASARGGGHVRRELKAPMPGLVVKVLTQTGDSVEAGQPLVVLQAMKMENELSLPRGGTVSSVGVAAGQTVEAGQVLAVIE